MKSKTFNFKQFAVEQDKCAMKVNTDGVLLGAWATSTGAINILDIGTGTGVIALMMAQQNEHAIIDAIDIDKDAYLQAKRNFETSNWAERLNAYNISLQNFVPDKKYDLLISNPPYFINDFKTANKQKNIARHSTELTYQDILNHSNRLLNENGSLYLVIPFFNLLLLQTIAIKFNLFISKVLEVTAQNGKKPYIVLIKLERTENPIKKSELIIQTNTGIFTVDYKQLTGNFYLKF